MLAYFRYTIITIYIVVVALLGQILSLLRPFNPSNLYYFARILSFGTEILGIKLKVSGRENIHNQTPSVYISNHQHNLDVLIYPRFVPKRTVSVGKIAILFIPIFGTFYALTGNILINRRNKAKAYKTLDKAHTALTEDNTSIWLMPEGTRSGTRGVMPFKKGAFLLAIRAGVPIVPVSTSSYHKFLNFNNLKAGNVLAQIHKPIDTGKYTVDNYTELLDICHKIIKDGNAQLDASIEKMLAT